MAILNLRGVDDGIYRKAKVAAFESGQTLTAWVAEALAMRLDRPKFEAGKVVEIDPATFGSGIIPVAMVTREELERDIRAQGKKIRQAAGESNVETKRSVDSGDSRQVETPVPERTNRQSSKKMSAEQYFALPYSEQARAVREGRY